MAYAKKGPFTNGAAPGIDKAFLDGVEGALEALQNGQGTLANRPAAGNSGARYYATDAGIEYRDNGTDWVPVADPDAPKKWALILGGS